MIVFTKSHLSGYVRIDGYGCAGLLTVEELRQLVSVDTREELLSLIDGVEGPIVKCERASERIRAMSARAPDTKRSPAP